MYRYHRFYCRKLIEKIAQVSMDDMKRVGPKYIAPLFDASQSNCAICCHPTKVKDVVSEFQKSVETYVEVLQITNTYM